MNAMLFKSLNLNVVSRFENLMWKWLVVSTNMEWGKSHVSFSLSLSFSFFFPAAK